MEELKRYLDDMFAGVDETPDILRAKAELLQMMEDKFEGLKADGHSEEEATRIVINEFGSFDEVAKELGVEDIVANRDRSGAAGAGNNSKSEFGPETEKYKQKKNHDERYKRRFRYSYNWNVGNIKEYFSFARKHASLVALGVALCILAPYFASVLDDLADHVFMEDAIGALSSLAFFVCIACAVGCFIWASRLTSLKGKINKDAVAIEESAQADLDRMIAKAEGARTAQLVCGIILCVLAPGFSDLTDLLPYPLNDIFDSSILLFVAIGVFLIVHSSSIGNRIKELKRAIRRFDENREDIPDAAAGSAHINSREKTGFPIALIVILVVVLGMGFRVSINLVRGIGVFGGSLFGVTGKNYDGNSEYPVSGVEGIDVDLSSGDVVVEGTDGDKVIVDFRGHFSSKPEVSWASNTGKITVKQRGGWHLFNWGSNDGVITIKVPKNSKLNYLFDMSAGDCSVKDIEARKLGIDMSAGDFSIKDSDVGEKTEIDMSAGDCTFENTNVVDLEADLSAGDFKFRFRDKADADKFSYDLDTSAGDVYFMGSETDDLKMGPKDSSDYHKMVVDGSAGDITIE